MMHCNLYTGVFKSQHFQSTAVLFWEGAGGGVTNKVYAHENDDCSGRILYVFST